VIRIEGSASCVGVRLSDSIFAHTKSPLIPIAGPVRWRLAAVEPLRASRQPWKSGGESVAKFVDVGEARIALAALYSADVCPVEVGNVGELLLRKADALPTLSQGCTEGSVTM
jgi:hypothetical protein